MSPATRPGRELFRRDTGLLHKKGWHPTGLYGAVGAAAACAKLRRLDAEKCGDGDRARGIAERRADGEFRHDDQAVPRRQGRACRHHGGPPGRGRLHRQHRRAGASAGLPARRSPPTAPRTARATARPGEDWAHPVAGPGHQEIPHLLLHASRDRLHAGSGRGPARSRPDEVREDHRQHQRLFRHRAA